MPEKSATKSSAPKPKNKRVWASVKKETKEVIEDVFCEAKARERELKVSQKEKVDKCVDYLLKYSDYLSYDQYLSLGYPITTGVIEVACRHLVNDRMEIVGARWRLERAEAVLKIRALKASDDLEEYWQFHQQEKDSTNDGENGSKVSD